MNVNARVTLYTEFFWQCYAIQSQDFSLLHNTSDPWHSIQLPVLCVYLLEWLWSNRFAVGNTLRNTTKLYLWWRVQSLFWPSACFQGNANLYSSTAFCIRLNSSKIHSSKNHVAACAAPFIPPHSLQLRVQCTYQHPQPRFQHPLSFEYLTYCILSACALLPQHWNPQDQRIQLKDHRDLNKLSLTPFFVVLISEILNLTKLQNRFFNYFYCHK